MNGIHPEQLKQLREYYTPGSKVRLLHMNDAFTTIPPGTIGEVLYVDSYGTVHTLWSNGSTLGIVFNEDYAVKIEEDELE